MTTSITKQIVADAARSSITGKLFGSRYIYIESFAFDTAGSLSQDYDGGHWDFITLSNGAFYMVPTGELHYRVHCDNGFEGQLSADAFGITVCLYAYSLLSFNPDEAFSATCARMYHLLRDYMLSHEKADLILGAID